MENSALILFILFIYGLFFWSFSSVIIERLHSGKKWIINGRSECPKCKHLLSWRELIPIFSYLRQWGKCQHCKTPISILYPLLEIFMGIIFTLMGYIGLSFGYTYADIAFYSLIFFWFITAIYIVYDILYREIPEKIMIIGYIFIIILLILTGSNYVHRALFDLWVFPTFHTYLIDHLFWWFILYTFVFMQILIPGGWYLLKKHQYKDCIQLIWLYFGFIIMSFSDFFWKQKKNHKEDSTLEIPTWIGGWDLYIALFIGLTLGTIHGIAAFFIAYILWSIYGITFLVNQHILKKKNTEAKNSQKDHNSHEVAFWPFLGIGWLLALLFYGEILSLFSAIFSQG